MTDQSSPSDVGTRLKLSRAFTTAGTAAGAVGAVNVISHAQNLVVLSASLQWIVSWWRFAVGSVFSWLNWDLAPLAQDVLTLVLLIAGGANADAITRFRRSYFLLMLDPDKLGTVVTASGSMSFQAYKDWATKKEYVFVFSTQALFIALLVWMMWLIPPVGITIVFSALVYHICLEEFEGTSVGIAAHLAMIILVILWVPYALVGSAAIHIGPFWRGIALVAGVAAGILLLNATFNLVVDPLAPILLELPEPPA